MQDLQAEIDAIIAIKPWIGWWINWIMIVTLASVFFMRKHKAARWVLVSLVPIMPLALLIFNLTQNVNLIGFAHLVVWIPLCMHLIQNEMRSDDFEFGSSYGIWMTVLVVTLIIAMAFDAYDIVMVLAGYK